MTSRLFSTPPFDGRITPLSRPTASAIRSSLVIPTFSQVLSELIHNSLDANAKKIECWIDLTKGSERIRVEDDGTGIDPEALHRVGKVYSTSKGLSEGRMSSSGTYGFRGEALSSIAALGLVDITTKVSEGKSLKKVIKGSKTVFHGIAPGPLYGDHGTIVIVKDLFHSIPVRQNALASTSATSAMSQCRRIIEAFALVHSEVKWSLWDDDPGGCAGGAKKVLSLNGFRTIVEVFRGVYGIAGVERVQNIRVVSGKRRIDGFISLEGSATKSHQHLYINHYPIERGELSRIIAKRFSASRFSIMTSDALDEDGSSQYKRRSPRRLERYPIYVLNVTLPHTEVDALYGPRKSVMGHTDLESVKAFVLAVVDEFLRRHDFISVPPLPIVTSVPLDSRPQVTRGGEIQSVSSQIAPRTPLRERLFQAPSTEKQTRATDASEDSQPRKRSRSNVTRIDHQCEEPGSGGEDWLEEILSSHRSRSRSRSHFSRSVSPTKQIAQTMVTDVDIIEANTSDSGSDSCHLHTRLPLPAKTSWTTQISLTPASLGNAIVLGQVDRKYVACVVKSEPEDQLSRRSLVLLDQHAADERISVERIVQELCEGFIQGNQNMSDLTTLSPKVVLTHEEGAVLRRPEVVEILRRWGIDLDIPEETNGAYMQVEVKAVPEILVGRLGRKRPVEITRLLKLHLPLLDDFMDEFQYLLVNIESNAEGVDWSRVLRFMPKEMLELANSKACRGAIMFQDRLDQEQCERLVDNLSKTRLPFMCAHGRPSIASLIVLRGPNQTGKRRIDWAQWSQRTSQ